MPTRYSADLSKFKDMVTQATGRAFNAICADHSGEEIYAFALYSDDGAMTVCPAANSEEALARTVRASESADPSELSYLRWGTGEWAYEFEGVDFFDDARAILNRLLESVDESEFESFRDEVFEATVAALEACEAAGVFGVGAGRNKITVFFTVSDSEGAEHWEEYSVRRVNPPEVAERFLRAFNL